MAEIPNTLEDAVNQAKEATKAALNDGYRLLQVELVFPEIALQAQSITQQFIPAIQELDIQPVVLFPDTGAAALARRDWGEIPYRIDDIGTQRSPIETKMKPEDELYLVVNPSAVEVAQVEKLYNAAGDRPLILLNPSLEDVSIVGIGYAARQLRERFINRIESCYYLRGLQGAAVWRYYPSAWQVWLEETEGEYKLIAEKATKPIGEELEQILIAATTPKEPGEQPTRQPQRQGFLAQVKSFLRALNQ